MKHNFISKRVNSIKPSPTIAVTSMARELKAAGKDVCFPKEANLAEFNSAKLSLNPIKFFNSFNVNLCATKANSVAFFEKIGFVGAKSMDKELLSFFAGEITTNI